MNPRSWDYPHLVLAALLVSVLLSVVAGASTTSATYGAYNGDWDGTSDLRTIAADADTTTHVVYDTDRYGAYQPHNSILVVISPDTAYSRTERNRLRGFVHRGGTLVVADDFGAHGNALLRAVGARARVNTTLVLDYRSNYRSETLPIASATANASVTNGVDQLTLNHPASVAPHRAIPVVRTSEFAFRDVDGDGKLSANESLRRHPVVTVEPVGEGRVVTVADPSLFVNAMLERPDNTAFVRNLFAPHARVLLDQSHLQARPPLVVAIVTLRTTPALQIVLGLLVVSGLYAVGERAPTEVEDET